MDVDSSQALCCRYPLTPLDATSWALHLVPEEGQHPSARPGPLPVYWVPWFSSPAPTVLLPFGGWDNRSTAGVSEHQLTPTASWLTAELLQAVWKCRLFLLLAAVVAVAALAFWNREESRKGLNCAGSFQVSRHIQNMLVTCMLLETFIKHQFLYFFLPEKVSKLYYFLKLF